MNRGARLTRSVEEGVVLALFDVANQLYKLGDAVAAGAGLTTQQWLLLLQVAGDPNFSRPSRSSVSDADPAGSSIARARGVSRANVSTLLSQLIAKGYQFVTVSQLLNLEKASMPVGIVVKPGSLADKDPKAFAQ